ncbi:MAG: hypothetical protein EOP45_11675 [Sphingobacteriaceae bacterium]|nr:MAG: hypothetical protein EOP45_11675 [Sphingobacteriaceae bacterium]
MSVRVGRLAYTNDGKLVKMPSFDNHTPIVVTTRYSEYASLSPFFLKSDNDQIIENVYQFAKIYPNVTATTKYLSRASRHFIWNHPSEEHVDQSGQPNDLYWQWRKKGMAANNAIRYPVGFRGRHECVGILWDDNIHQLDPTAKIECNKESFLPYIEGRKKVYYPLYRDSVIKQPNFEQLKQRILGGENLLVLEPDGPHQESLQYYKTTYGVDDDFIVDDSMQATKNNLQIMMDDVKHPFGHGYCLAALLQDISV